MAESSEQLSLPNLTPGVNLYDTLGVSFDSTDEEIRKAYRDRARQVHPDKSTHPEAREWMQKINEAYHVLGDKIQRQTYDEKLQDEEESDVLIHPLAYLPSTSKVSDTLKAEMIKWNEDNLSVKTVISEYTLFECLHKGTELAQLLNNVTPELIKLSKLSAKLARCNNQEEVIPQVSRYSSLVPVKDKRPKIDSLYCRMQSLICQARKRKKKKKKTLPRGNSVPIIDFSSATKDDLLCLLDIFYNSEFPHRRSHDKILMGYLAEFIPCTTVQMLDTSKKRKKRECVLCRQPVPSKDNKFCLPRYGLLQPQRVCDVCRDMNHTEDMQCWVDAGLAFLQAEEPNVHAGVGCLYMAHCSRPPGTRSLLQDAQELIRLGSPDMAFPFIATALESTRDARDIVKAHSISSNAFKKMAENTKDLKVFEKYQLLLAAKEACQLVSESNLLINGDTGSEDLTGGKSSIELDLAAIVEQKKQEWNDEVKSLHAHLEVAWTEKDYDSLLNILKGERNEDLIRMNDNKDYVLEAVRLFLDSKKSSLDGMSEENKGHLLFLKGYLNLGARRFKIAFSLMHTATLLAPLSLWLQKSVINLILCSLHEYLETIRECFDFALAQLKTLKNTLPSDTEEICSLTLFPTVEQLQPPSTCQWPELSTNDGVNVYKYEKAVLKQVKEGEMNEKAAAMAYIDLVTACEHSSQVATCFVNAALWLLKHFTLLLRDPKHSRQDLYVDKKAILWCCESAFAAASRSLHPAMQTYTFRLIIGVMLRCAELCPKLTTPNESKSLLWWLHKLFYNVRLCLFLDFPTVMTSEALILHIVTGQLHSQYLLALQDVHPDNSPIMQDLLQYHIYENDLKKLHPLEDDKGDSKVNAMIAMLEKKGLVMDDVSSLLTSPLSPRSDEGWLIQQTTLGSCEEYSHLRGFIIDTDPDKPSISILVDPTDEMRGKIGLFSTSDINTVLQLDPAKHFPLFFSLDPPNLDQTFHPFQEFRFEPQALAGTDLLHTLFETDYILKSFTVGSDISSIPPFQQRSNHDGLTRNLPLELQELLKPMHKRGPSTSHTNRFWIQADELLYTSEQKGSQTIYYVSEPKMSICTHPILPGSDGKMHDTENGQNPDSPQVKFAQDFTAHYDQIARYFPMFARLKEIVKLQFFVQVINGIHDSLRKSCNNEITVTSETLKKIHQENATNMIEGLSKMYSSIQSNIESARQHNRHRSQYDRTIYVIPTHEEITSQMTDTLMRDIQGINRKSLKAFVSSWISSGASPSATLKLALYISMSQITKQDVVQKTRQSYQRQFDAFNRLFRQLRNAAQTSVSTPESCIWVPAAFHEEERSAQGHYFSYGGVVLAPNIQRTHFPRTFTTPPQTVHLDIAKLSAASPRDVKSDESSQSTTTLNVGVRSGSHTKVTDDITTRNQGPVNIIQPPSRPPPQMASVNVISTAVAILHNASTIMELCRSVLDRLLLTIPGDVLHVQVAECIDSCSELMDCIVTTTQGVFLVACITTGSPKISISHLYRYIQHVLICRQKCIDKAHIDGKEKFQTCKLILVCMTEDDTNADLSIYSVKLDALHRKKKDLIDAKDVDETKRLFLDLKAASSDPWAYLEVLSESNKMKALSSFFPKYCTHRYISKHFYSQMKRLMLD